MPGSGWRGRIAATDNLSRDEALLRAGELAAEVAVLTDRTVTLGVSQPSDVPSAIRARQLAVPVHHRSSGGTGLLHEPEDLAWAIVLPRTHPLAGRDFSHAYPRLGAGVVTALSAWGVPSAWRGSPGLSDEFCLLGPRGATLFGRALAIGGAAQHLTGRSLLHHGILSISVDRKALSEIFALPPEIARQVGGLRDLGVDRPADELGVELLEGLSRAFGISTP